MRPVRWILCLALAAAALPAAAGELDRSFAVGRGGQLVIALDFGSVAVERHDGDELSIQATARGVGASSVRFDAHSEGRDVYFASDAEPWVHLLHTAPGVHVRARVPRGVSVEIQGPRSLDVAGAPHSGPLHQAAAARPNPSRKLRPGR
ncbi:MAG: hypothetical protein ACQGVC_25260 [Myxococcota bacterium]